MENNYVIKKNNPKKQKDYLYKYNCSNNHKKTKTEANIFDENQKLKNQNNIKSLRIQNSKISLIPENISQKNIKKINSVRPLTSSFYSNIDIFVKSKNIINKNSYKNTQSHQPSFNLQYNNNPYINIPEKKRNTFGYEDKELTIKKNKSNTSISHIQQLKSNHSIDYKKKNNSNDNSKDKISIKNNQEKDFVELNKIIKKEKKIILSKLNSSKSSNNFINEYNNEILLPNKVNKYKYNYLSSYSSKYNDCIFNNSDLKSASINMSYGGGNGASFSEANKNVHKLKSFNSSSIISSSLLGKKNNKKGSIFGQYYIDIDLSLNNNSNSKDNTSIINKRLLKKTINLDNSIQKENKKNANIINSPILEKNKKNNSKSIIDLRNSSNLNILNKKSNFTSRERVPNAISPQTKKIEINKTKNKTTKNNLIPHNTNKIIPMNNWKNSYLLNHANSNKNNKKNNYNITGQKLKKNTNKKELFYNNESKIWKDYINFQKKIKSISQTPKNKIESHDNFNFNFDQMPKNYINLNSNYLTEKRYKKNVNRTEIFEFKNMNKNKKNIYDQENIFLTQKYSYFDEFTSLDNYDTKLSGMGSYKKVSKDFFKKNLSNKKDNLNEYNNTQENVNNNNNNNIRNSQKRIIDSNIKDMNLIDSLSNLEHHCLNLNNIVNNKSNKNNKNYDGMQIIVSNTDSGQKKLSISPTSKLYIFQYNGNNGSNKKNNKININIDESNSKNVLNNKLNANKNGNKIINYTEYNKELQKNLNYINNNNNNNNNKKESYTLLKSISFCKKINNPVKLNPKKKDIKINKAFYIPSYVKKIYMPTQNNSNNNNKCKKFNNTVEIKQNNNRINTSISGYNKKYKNNIINITNNTSNVNLLNVKNSSINICFEKKEKYKDLSLEKNINYSTTVNSVHRNKINMKNNENEPLEKNKNLKNITKIKSNVSQLSAPSYIKLSTNSNKNYNTNNNNRNENKFYSNVKKGNYNLKNNTQQLNMYKSEIQMARTTKPNKDKDFLEKNSRLKLNDFKDNIDNININRISLNSERNNIYNNEIIEKTMKIQNNYKKINLPVFSANNSINAFNKKLTYGVYVKPTFALSRSKSKKNKTQLQTQTEIQLKKDTINKTLNKNSISGCKRPYKLSKSLNAENLLNTPTNINAFKNKLNMSIKLSNRNLKSCKSARNIRETSIENKNNKKTKRRLNFINLNKNGKKVKNIRNKLTNNYCFIYKFYNYIVKQPMVNRCYFIKNCKKRNLDKDQSIKLNILENNNKENIQNQNNNINNDNHNKFFNLSIEKMNKDELNNENTNKITLSNNKINNDDEKINESSQNGLIMTFGEVNYNNKKNSEKISGKNIDILSQINNDIINDESDLDIYKKLNIMHQDQVQDNKIEDKYENDDIKFNFSDEEVSDNCNILDYNPLYNSNKINNNDLFLFYDSTNGKECIDIDRKVSKTFKKSKIGDKYKLENAEKGLSILKKIVVRRGYKSGDEQINKKNKNYLNNINNINKIDNINNSNYISKEIDKNKNKIFLGTNKLNELFNNRKEKANSYNKKNNYNYNNIRHRNKYSRSVNKDIVKGITKIENIFEKKNLNFNNKINTYEGKNRDGDISNDNSCDIENIIDYDENLKPKIRTYVQKSKNNLYFSNSNIIILSNNRESTNNNYNDENVNVNFIENNNSFKISENNDGHILNENKNIINDNDNLMINKEENTNNTFSLKENLIKEFTKEIIKDENNDNNIKREKEDKNKIIIFPKNLERNSNNSYKYSFPTDINNNYLTNIIEYQSNNCIKYNIIYLLNIIIEENYSNILNKIKEIILYQNNNINNIYDINNINNINNLSQKDLNNNEDIIKNEHIFKDIIFEKGIMETIYTYLYAKLCNDLNNIISNTFKEQKNLKNNKERNLKYIISEECIILLNKYKNISKEHDITNIESDKYILLRKKMIGYAIFAYELINLELLKQQFGLNILEQFYKKYIDNDVNNIYKNLYLETCIVLLNKLGKIIFDKNNNKLIPNLNNYINNLSNIINMSDIYSIPSHLKYKIINIIKKNENSWKESLFEISLKEKYKLFYEENEINEENKNKELISINSIEIKKEGDGGQKMENKSHIIEEDLSNYISYFTERDENGQIIIKNKVDKSYNWKAIEELINEKNYGLEYIINQFIQICSNTIHEENQLLISNDYIKNIIEYYSNNLPKNTLDSIHNDMIKTYLNIDDFLKNNYCMSKILGNLLFILIENKLYHIKDFNNYLKVEKQTQINLAIITRYCIISAGKFSKKYFNDFKQTKLFLNNIIFKQYVSDALKDLFYFKK